MKYSLPTLVSSLFKRTRTPLMIGVFALLMLGWQQSYWPAFTDIKNRLEGMIYDVKIQYLPPWPSSQTNIQIVEIDEQSLAELGRMPWNRDIYAELTNALARHGALVITYDILFSEAQENPMSVLKESTEIDFNTSHMRTLVDKYDYDRQFTESLATTDTVMAVQLLQSPQQINALPSAPLSDASILTKMLSRDYRGYASILKGFAAENQGLGFMNSMPDSDGTIRRSPLFLNVQQQPIPSLALETYRVYSLVETIEPLIDTSHSIDVLTGFQIGHRTVNTDELGQMLIPYQGPSGVMSKVPNPPYPYTSASDIIRGRIHDDRFADSVVFIGSTAIGLGDLQVTPVGINYPGVEIHATVFDALMSDAAIPFRPDWELGAVALQLFIIVLIALFAYPRLGPWSTLVLSMITLISVISFNAIAWQLFYLDLSILPILVLCLLFSFYFVTRGFLSESLQRNRVKTMFGQYVPSAHIDKLLATPKTLSLKGERKTLTVMFCDIRSFTSISETMSAEQLKDWLNQFFSPITQDILKHEGTIDKYVGDMVMAFWGAPLEDTNHAQHGIDAAFEMLESLTRLNEAFVQRSLPIANIGIGLNTGEMNVGDMGSSFRRAYTVIGDAVNLGSRLEGLTKYYGVTILLSEQTKRQAPQTRYVSVDRVKVKGKIEPIAVFTPLPPDAKPDMVRRAAELNSAMEHYFNQDFFVSKVQLESLLEDPNLEFGVLTRLMLERSNHFIAEPPDANWDGSFQHTQK